MIKKPLNIYCMIILTLIDVLCYGILHEQYGFNFFWTIVYNGIAYYPLYRIFQGILDIGSMYWVYKQRGIYQLIGMILAWYFMVKEMLYYIILNQWDLLYSFQTYNIDVYWLKRVWFSGLWIFANGFTVDNFIVSFAVGITFLIISNFIKRSKNDT